MLTTILLLGAVATTSAVATAGGAAALTCHSISPRATNEWCNANCNHLPPNCPASLCKCSGPGPGPSPGPRPAPGPAPGPPPGPGPTTNVTGITTFYGAKDNCPPGGAIAFPSNKPGRHEQAGGLGTAADPITFAGVKTREAPGSLIYVPSLKKYFVMEDSCEECVHQWRHNKKFHVDLWMGPDTVSPGPELIACENALTSMHRVVLRDPPRTLTVDPAPIFANGTCSIPAPPCHDVGNQCGNSCQIPKTESCAGLEALFGLTAKRFVELNPKLDCSKDVPQGTSVCMGGTCGD